jgi:hypothetical protein
MSDIMGEKNRKNVFVCNSYESKEKVGSQGMRYTGVDLEFP